MPLDSSVFLEEGDYGAPSLQPSKASGVLTLLFMPGGYSTVAYVKHSRITLSGEGLGTVC